LPPHPPRRVMERRSLESAGLAARASSGTLAAALPTEEPAKSARLKVLAAGAHPDDPGPGCGRTIARYTDRGHGVAVLYPTRGAAAGIPGMSHEEAATRSAQARGARAALKARPLFAGRHAGRSNRCARPPLVARCGGTPRRPGCDCGTCSRFCPLGLGQV
jgi:hypothetical protein